MNTYEVYAVPVASCSKDWDYLGDFQGETEQQATDEARRTFDMHNSVILVAMICSTSKNIVESPSASSILLENAL